MSLHFQISTLFLCILNTACLSFLWYNFVHFRIQVFNCFVYVCVCVLMMWSDCGWSLGEGANFHFSWGTKNWVFWALSGRESTLVQTFCETCVHLDITHSSVHMTRRFEIQGCPTKFRYLLWIFNSINECFYSPLQCSFSMVLGLLQL